MQVSQASYLPYTRSRMHPTPGMKGTSLMVHRDLLTYSSSWSRQLPSWHSIMRTWADACCCRQQGDLWKLFCWLHTNDAYSEVFFPFAPSQTSWLLWSTLALTKGLLETGEEVACLNPMHETEVVDYRWQEVFVIYMLNSWTVRVTK